MQSLHMPPVRAWVTRAFTLIELLMVLVILTVLAAVAVPIYIHQLEKARYDGTLADISNIKSSLETFYVNNSRYPSTNEGLLALVQAPPDLQETWSGPYLEKVPVDKWGHSYEYAYPAPEDPKTFSLNSSGKDGEFGTEDDITRYTGNGAPAAN